MARFKGKIVGENRNVEFDFTERRKAYTDIYNYLAKLSESEEFWDMLECDEDRLEEYTDLIESVHLRLDSLIFEILRLATDFRQKDLLHRIKLNNWYSNRGLRDIIIKQLIFISENTYYKLYNADNERLERLYMEEVSSV